uniref:hypothetical protein n=1 Tax=Pararhizobium sp. IMCC3301 TaxID=3067904 RepID=UPI002742199C|nr:hypothetical protein [Pararhizobium sp. IMCC3301]
MLAGSDFMVRLKFLMIVCATVLAASPGPLRAQSLDDLLSQSLGGIFSRTIDNSLRQWLEQTTGLGAASGRIGDVTTRPSDSALLINGISLSAPGLELTVDIKTAVLERPRRRDGGYVVEADNITLDDVTIRQGRTEFAIDRMVLQKAALPRLSITRLSSNIDQLDKFERQRRFLAELFGLQAEQISIPTLSVRTYSSRKEMELISESIYRDNTIEGLKNRTIAQWRFASNRSLSPPVEPLISESFQGAKIDNLSIDAVLTLLDPQTGFETARTLIGQFSARNYAVSLAGLTVSIDAIRLADFAMDPLDAAVKETLIKVVGNPNGIDGIPSSGVPPFLLNMAAAFSLGNLELQGFRVEALGIDDFAWDSMKLSAASLKGFDDFELQGFRSGLTDVGRVDFTVASVKDVVFPDKQVLLAKLAGDPVPLAALVPKLAAASLSGFAANVPEMSLEGGIESLDLKMQTDTSGVPAGVVLSLQKLRVPTSLIPEGNALLARLTGTLNAMNIGIVELNQSLTLSYDAASQALELQDLDIDIRDLGRFQASARIADVATSPFADPAQAGSSIRQGKLVNSQLSFENYGVVEAGFDAQAKKLNTKGDVLRNQVGATLPFLVAVLQNPRFQKELVDALQAFLPDPQGLVVTLAPEAGVAISEIERQLRSDPRKLLALLGVSIQNKASIRAEEPLRN